MRTGKLRKLVGETVEPFRKEIVLATKLHFYGAAPKDSRESDVERRGI